MPLEPRQNGHTQLGPHSRVRPQTTANAGRRDQRRRPRHRVDRVGLVVRFVRHQPLVGAIPTTASILFLSSSQHQQQPLWQRERPKWPHTVQSTREASTLGRGL